jgi:S1-C subfamily serine protease
MSRRPEGEMKQARIWDRASLAVAIGLVAASAVAFAAAARPDDQTHSFTYLMNPGPETWMGVIVTDVNQAKAQEFKLPGVYGALVVSVFPGSPAEKAGVRANDVILAFAGERVWSAAQLQRMIKETPADRTVSIKISRQGKLQTLQVKIEDRGPSAQLEQPANPEYHIWIRPYELPAPQRPEPFVEPVPKGKIIPLPPVIPKFKLGPIPNPEAPESPQVQPVPPPGPEGQINPLPPSMPKYYLGPLPNLKPLPLPKAEPFVEPVPKGEIPLPPSTPFNHPFSMQENSLGISGQGLTPELAHFFGVKEGHGILISRVDPGSPASAAGLKVGDVIVRVGTKQVGSMAELQQALQSQENSKHKVTMVVVRNHQEWELGVLLPPASSAPEHNGVKPEPIMALMDK